MITFELFYVKVVDDKDITALHQKLSNGFYSLPFCRKTTPTSDCASIDLIHISADQLNYALIIWIKWIVTELKIVKVNTCTDWYRSLTLPLTVSAKRLSASSFFRMLDVSAWEWCNRKYGVGVVWCDGIWMTLVEFERCNLDQAWMLQPWT